MKRMMSDHVRACTALALPVQAQEEDRKIPDGTQGAELFLEGLRQGNGARNRRFARAWSINSARPCSRFMQEMGPALAELAAQVQDWSAYEAPEMLPNGDIIIRKKPMDQPEDPAPQEESADGNLTDI